MRNFIFGLFLLMFVSFGTNAVEIPDLGTDVLMEQEHAPPEIMIPVNQVVIEHVFIYMAQPPGFDFATDNRNAERLKNHYAGFNFGKRTIVNSINLAVLHVDPGRLSLNKI